MPKKIDLTGRKFGRLTVTGEAPRHYTAGGHSQVMWYCDCDCGKKNIVVRSGDLRNGHTQSCGCLNIENNRKTKFRPRNRYDLTGTYGIGYTQKGEEFWFDLEDYNIIKNYNWRIHKKYVEAYVPMSNPRRQICMHRLVMGLDNEVYDYTKDVDHIKTEHKFDNRKSNLRVVNKRENNCNRVLQKNNTSGYSGIYWAKDRNKWRVRININGKRMLFSCDNLEEAYSLRRELEDEYYGNYSYRRSQEIAEQNVVLGGK